MSPLYRVNLPLFPTGDQNSRIKGSLDQLPAKKLRFKLHMFQNSKTIWLLMLVLRFLAFTFTFTLFVANKKKKVSSLLLIERGGGGRGRQGGQSLPLPVPRSPASRTFVPLYLPTPTLHSIAPVFSLIKRIRHPGVTFKLCQNLTFLSIFWFIFLFIGYPLLLPSSRSPVPFHYISESLIG